jgi:AraC-like DNA-binding protein
VVNGLSYENFIKLVPKKVLADTKVVKSEEIVIFRPREYITDVELYTSGYHFVLPSSTPPPTKVENKQYQFSKGKLIVFNPETRVLTNIKVPTEEYIALTISKQFFQSISLEAVGKFDVSFKRQDNIFSRRLVNLICDYEEEIQYFENSSPLMLKSIVTQIVIQLLREARSNVCVEQKRLFPEEKYITRAQEYIQSCYNSNVTLEDICSFIHLSEYHFIRVFTKYTGTTPHQYLIKFRIQKAEDLLRSGKYKVEEVAKLSGFISAAHFIAQFKKIKGVTPNAYKKAIF